MSEKGIGKVNPKTRMMLWTVSAGRCCLCNQPVWKDWFTHARGNFGEVAHIIGNRLDVPGREKKKLSHEYVNEIENLMLLCPIHHQLIDYVEPENYPDDRLRKIKQIHETRIEIVTENAIAQSIFVKYGANIDSHHAVISNSDARLAMNLNGWYPRDENPIKLGIDNSVSRDTSKDFWQLHVKELENQYMTKIHPQIESGEEVHFSIFALAPIPLLIKLGSLFSDKIRTEVYQLHREPQTWCWQEGPDESSFIILEPKILHPTVALIIAFSDTVTEDRIIRSLGDSKVSIWTLTVPNPDKDFFVCRKHLSQFREEFRNLLGRIKQKHGEETSIHVFPAMGVAPAVEIGRVWQPKADLPMIIYDENKSLDGFAEAIRIDNIREGNDDFTKQ
jgi:hypothetical protein